MILVTHEIPVPVHGFLWVFTRIVTVFLAILAIILMYRIHYILLNYVTRDHLSHVG